MEDILAESQRCLQLLSEVFRSELEKGILALPASCRKEWSTWISDLE